jgi:hypothetical protein
MGKFQVAELLSNGLPLPTKFVLIEFLRNDLTITTADADVSQVAQSFSKITFAA